MDNLLIIGAGQYGMLTYDIAASLNCYGKISFLDDNNPKAIGKTAEYEKFLSEYLYAVVAIGNAEIREKFLKQLKAAGFKLVSVVSPLAHIFPSAKIGEACVIEPFTVVSTEAVVGDGCFISAGAVINHNARVGNICHINCNATVASGAEVPPGTKTPCGVVIEK